MQPLPGELLHPDHQEHTVPTEEELENSIMKSTSHDMTPPPEKHMARILGAPDPKRVISRLDQRLRMPEWIVTLKVTVIFHRMLKEGPEALHGALVEDTGMFLSPKISYLSHHTPYDRFVAQYYRYLEERCAATRTLNCGLSPAHQHRIENEAFCEIFNGLTNEKQLQLTSCLHYQLAALLQIEMDPRVLSNPTIDLALSYLVEDCRHLTRVITERCMILLDHAMEMTDEEKRRLVDIFRSYNSNLYGINRLFGGIKEVPSFEGLPHMTLLPLDRVESIIRDSEGVQVCRLEDILPPTGPLMPLENASPLILDEERNP
jgi:hypothetical protein